MPIIREPVVRTIPSNLLKDRVRIGVKVSVLTPTGETVAWGDLGYRYARVIPLSVTERIAFQQLKSEVSHKIVMRGALDYKTIPKRFLWNGRILETTESPKEIHGMSIIIANELPETEAGFTASSLLHMGSNIKNMYVSEGALIINYRE